MTTPRRSGWYLLGWLVCGAVSCGWPECPTATAMIDVGVDAEEGRRSIGEVGSNCHNIPCADGHFFGPSDEDPGLTGTDPGARDYVLFRCFEDRCGPGFDGSYCMSRADLDAQLARVCPECPLSCDFDYGKEGSQCVPVRCDMTCENYAVQ